MERYYSLNRFLREQFGYKLYRLALDGGMTCPNRDGTLGTRGCVFCSAGGSGEFAERPQEDIALQIERAKQRIAAKARGCGGYIAYFQSYTNTYAPVEKLERLFTAAIRHPEIRILSIATRPDCLGDEVLELLARLNREKPVWVELGLQTSRDDTAERICRGYPTAVYKEAVERLKARGIGVITHIIIGLPGEDREDALRSADYACRCGSEGLKLHLLSILKGSQLAEEYPSPEIRDYTMEEYFSDLAYILERLPEDVVIHRLTGDGPKNLLIAPQWTADKKNVLNSMKRYFDRFEMIQGKYRQEKNT